MAPRSKPTTSRKGKEIAEDSNAHKRARPAAPTYELYVSGEAKQQATIFSSWLAIAEREVDLDSLNHTTLSAIIHDNGWTQLCSKPHSIYMEVVREFMVNFTLQSPMRKRKMLMKRMFEGFGFLLAPMSLVTFTVS
ncbi:hypothetical protein Adt_23019 [Abeliophyllum distichum]|uniref:Uncharacterized protein n=1 Tax=Abeliophyllum distichum TaxID=126358 RepID=A0ABD1SD54_9LAMI